MTKEEISLSYIKNHNTSLNINLHNSTFTLYTLDLFDSFNKLLFIEVWLLSLHYQFQG